MRTTITLDPDVAALVQRAMAERGLGFKEAVNEARLDYYRYKPMHECAKSLILAGAKVDHRRGGKKDVTDALAGICRTLTERWMVAQPPASGTVRSAYVTGAQRRGRRTALDRLG